MLATSEIAVLRRIPLAASRNRISKCGFPSDDFFISKGMKATKEDD
jgi:hypothetical protein